MLDVVREKSASAVLDDAYRRIASGDINAGMDFLTVHLEEWRAAVGADAWEDVCRSELLEHPVTQLLLQDPFTQHSLQKPSGYAGDARLLDYIYGNADAPDGTTPLGREIFRYGMNRHAPRSVRARCDVLARAIDETAERFTSPRILSVASGHLREAGRSRAVAEGRVGELVALDQDADSLFEVEARYADKGVRTICNSVRGILTGRLPLQGFHLVYSAGLYDYLSDRVAARLTRAQFDMLAPGGRLLIANFAPCLPDIAYMEAYMAWKLIYRDPEQMVALARDISGGEWTSHRMFWDEHENVIFLEITKRSKPTATLNKRAIDAFVAGGGNGNGGGRGSAAANASVRTRVARNPDKNSGTAG